MHYERINTESIKLWFKTIMAKFNWFSNLCSDTGRARYEIRNAGVANSVLMDSEEFEGADFIVTSGDYDKLLEKVKHKNFIQKKSIDTKD